MKFEGLSHSEAKKRLEQFGNNSLPEEASDPFWWRFAQQFNSPLIYILLFALVMDVSIWVMDGARGLPLESVAIGLILFLNAGLGVYQEGKAEAALAKLKALSAPLVWVMREGQLIRLSSSDLVPGDVLRVEAGERISADGNLLEAQGLMVDEALLTGESVPVEKEIAGEVYGGTLVVRGKGFVEISRTGAASAMGKLAIMIGGIEAGKTPLERRLEDFGRQVAYAILALSVLIVVAGLYVEGWGRIGHILLFSVALAVAAVPEGLPAVLTMTLSLGVERMAKRKAVVRRLSAVEALGSITTIATDKTGTLTENRMNVKKVDLLEAPRSLRAMILANDAEASAGAGDPLEIALIEYAAGQGLDAQKTKGEHTRLSILPFDSKHKFMRVTVAEAGGVISYLKGAPEVIISRCQLEAEEQQSWNLRAETNAAQGFRVLALAWREGEGDEKLNLLGLVMLWDPPRPEVPQAICQAQEAGIRVVMITGDHPATAQAVAQDAGLSGGGVITGEEMDKMSDEQLNQVVRNVNIFARVAPAHKLRLVEALQAKHEVVAVTGDGVNDAPALKRSDVGVAMGERGSDVAREVADIVLLDDNFASIVAAIDEGRGIYENILKFIRFLFAANVALVLVVVSGSIGSFLLGLKDEFGNLLLPFTAVQLLWINVITNGPPALALGLDSNSGLMRQSPRDSKSSLLDRASLSFIFIAGVANAILGGVLLFFMPRMGYNLATTRTGIFLFESISVLYFAYAARCINSQPSRNVALHLAVLIGTALQISTVYLPFLRGLLGLTQLDRQAMGLIAVAIIFSWAIAEIASRFIRTK